MCIFTSGPRPYQEYVLKIITKKTERETETQSQTDTVRETNGETDTDTETDRHRQRDKRRQTDTDRQTQKDRQTRHKRDRQTQRQRGTTTTTTTTAATTTTHAAIVAAPVVKTTNFRDTLNRKRWRRRHDAVMTFDTRQREADWIKTRAMAGHKKTFGWRRRRRNFGQSHQPVV